jgi:hypothetical protein
MFGARIKQSLLAVVVTTATVAGSATFFGSPVQAATPDSGTANAYGLHVALFGGNIVAAEPDAVLPANGSPVTLTQTLPVNVPGLISANTLNASVSSTNFGTAAETINAAAGAEGISGGGSTLLGVSALNLLNVGAVQSNCTSSASGSTGGTSIANLTIGNGTPINLPNDTTAPNTGLTAAELGPLAGVVTIVLNKQVTSDTHANPPTSGSTSIQVIGMEITLLGGVDAGAVIDIAQSFCQATGPDIEAPPVVTSVVPNVGPVAGGTKVTINGSGFLSNSTVDFGSVAVPPANVTYVSPNQLTAVSPVPTDTTTNSTVAVSVSGTFGSGTTTPNASNSFTYEVVPTILTTNGLNPNTGPVYGGTLVTISGNNFGPDSTVTFCVPPADTTCATATIPTGGITIPAPTVANPNPTDTILAYSPKSLLSGTGAGPEDVAVHDVGGTSTPQTFTYFVPAVSVTSVAPSAGPVSTGTPVVITGSGFSASSTVAFCTPVNTDTTCVAATAVSDATSSPSTILDATSPATIATPATYDVIVTTPQNPGTASSPPVAGDQFTFEAVPTITTNGIVPDSGPVVGGTKVTITGTGFVPADSTTSVSFGGAPATSVMVVNSTSITAVSPPSPIASPGGGIVQVTVTDLGGTSGNQPFTYVPPPTINPISTNGTTGISPDQGPTAGGTNVTIQGTGFLSPATVTFAGNQASNVVVVNSTDITATSPAGIAGAAPVIVNDSGGASNAVNFTYLAPPNVGADGLNPAYGPDSGGTTVTITGTGLTGITSVVFGATTCTTGSPVTGGVAGSTPVDSTTSPDTSATTITPKYPTDGPVPVCITAPGGSAYALEEFTFESNPPVVTSLSPTSGTTAGGTLVTITGTGFGPGDPNNAVAFGGVAGTSVTAVSTTEITVLTPAHAPGPVAVTVTDSAGGPVTASQQYTFVTPPPTPVLDGISPTSGPPGGGETVTIQGSNLCNATGVTFGSASATITNTNGACTVLTVTEPAGTGTVPVIVTTPGGTAQSPENFTYIQPGYWEAASDGGVFAFGGAQFYGSVPQVLGPQGRTLDSPIVAMADTPDHGGYWLFAADGGVFTFGDAQFYGSVPGVLDPEGRHLNGPIVAAEATPDGGGYRMFAADGGVFDFGDALFEGSLPGEFITPSQPISGAVTYPFGQGPNPNNAGYWLVARDGGIFTFTNAPFEGSAVGQVSGSVVSMATTPDGNGYYIFEANGGVISEGDALSGLGGASGLNAPIVFGQATSTGKGYWEFASNGGVFSYGDAPYEGSLGSVVLNEPITAGIAFGANS